MKVLVTGGAGYIGCVVTRELLQRGYSVRVLDKLYFGREPLKNLEGKIELVQGDIRNLNPSALEGIDAVIHLAALSNDPTAEYNPTANNEINTLGTKKLAEACIERKIWRFTFGSSASIYDRGLEGPDEIQDENAKVEPKAAYSVSKFEAEKELLKLAEKHENFIPVIFRKGTVYGYSPRMRYDLVVNTFVKNAMCANRLSVFCSGKGWRPLADVTDAAKAHILGIAAPAEKVRAQIFNVSYENYQILDLAHRTRYALGEMGINTNVDVDYSPDKIDRSYRISNKKIEEVLGFRHRVSVEQSVQDMVKKIKENHQDDFGNPVYYNIRWMELLKNMEDRIKAMGSVF